MPVITPPSFVLGGDEATYGLTADHPVIGWRNVATGITATSSNPNYPVSNLLNPATHLRWQAAGAAPTNITVSFASQEVNYIAFARHNLYSIRCPVTLGGLVASHYLPNDGPVLYRFNAFTTSSLTLGFDPTASTPAGTPFISVIYVGKLLTLPRKIYQGLAPINYGRVAKVTNGRSEAGQFLGRIVLQEFVKDTIPLSLISPTYFRDHIADFLIDSKENPFFFGWRPQTYPYEIGYCHMTNDPLPVNEAPHGLIAMQMEMTGVV